MNDDSGLDKVTDPALPDLLGSIFEHLDEFQAQQSGFLGRACG